MPNYIPLEEASSRLEASQRILVIGCSGVGKSTLSQRLAKNLNLQYFSLDRDAQWLPGWVVREQTEQRDILCRMVSGDRWVIDGSYLSSLDIRLPRTDLVIWLDLPRTSAYIGLAKRIASGYGRVRPDMAKGCPEQLPDMEFLSYIWNFKKRSSPKIAQMIETHGPSVPVVVVKSRAEVNWLTT